jgi:branched-subunit amino acid permease
MSTNPLIIVIYQSIYIYIMYILAAADSTLYRKVGSFFEGKKRRTVSTILRTALDSWGPFNFKVRASLYPL